MLSINAETIISHIAQFRTFHSLNFTNINKEIKLLYIIRVILQIFARHISYKIKKGSFNIAMVYSLH